MLAGVAAVCGAGVRVRVTPAWDEPLVLWQTVVGEPSTGKSAALAPMRRLLDVIEQERRAGDEERRVAHAEHCKRSGENAPFMPSQIVATAADPATLLPTLVDIVAGNPRGVLLWRDGATAWIGDEDEEDGHRASWLAGWTADAVTVTRPRQPARSVARFPVSILETIRPERLKESLQVGRRRPGRALPVRLARAAALPHARSRRGLARRGDPAAPARAVAAGDERRRSVRDRGRCARARGAR